MNNTGIYLLVVAVGALALAGCSRESADWKSASAADTTEAYQQFLQQYPKSAESAQAQTRIKQIADDRDWQAAAAADTRDAYEQFVAQHADSKWAQEARIRIENFAQSGAAHGSTAAAATTSAASVAAAPPATATGSSSAKVASSGKRGHFAQLGAFHSKERAEAAWKKLAAKYPTELKSLKPHVVAGTSKNGPVYKLRVGMASREDARSLCATLKKHAQACVPVTA